jgi:hypothetical protein
MNRALAHLLIEPLHVTGPAPSLWKGAFVSLPAVSHKVVAAKRVFCLTMEVWLREGDSDDSTDASLLR